MKYVMPWVFEGQAWLRRDSNQNIVVMIYHNHIYRKWFLTTTLPISILNNRNASKLKQIADSELKELGYLVLKENQLIML